MKVKNIESWIMTKLPHDKCLHIIAGAMVFSATHASGGLIALGAVLGIGVAKEVVDHFTGGDVSVWDIAATCAGGLLGLACYIRV